VRIESSHHDLSQILKQVLIAKAIAKVAQDRPVEPAEKDRFVPKADEPDHLPAFGEFLERENLEEVRRLEVETRVVERDVLATYVRDRPAGEAPAARDEGEDRVKYGAPRIGDVFEDSRELRGEKPESLRYGADGRPSARAASGFVAVMIDVIA